MVVLKLKQRSKVDFKITCQYYTKAQATPGSAVERNDMDSTSTENFSITQLFRRLPRQEKGGQTRVELMLWFNAINDHLCQLPQQVVFTLRHSRHVGGRKQKISNQLLLFVHQQLYIAALLSVSLKIGCKPPISRRRNCKQSN